MSGALRASYTCLWLINPGATRILRLPISAYRGRPLSDIAGLQGFADAVRQRFEMVANDPTPGERLQWQEAYELQLANQPEALTLLVRGASFGSPQSAERLRAEALRDPFNRLLSRGPRLRVEGEIVRDIALAACGKAKRILIPSIASTPSTAATSRRSAGCSRGGRWGSRRSPIP